MRLVQKFGPFQFGEPQFGEWPAEPVADDTYIDGPAMPPEGWFPRVPRHRRYRSRGRVHLRAAARWSGSPAVHRSVARPDPPVTANRGVGRVGLACRSVAAQAAPYAATRWGQGLAAVGRAAWRSRAYTRSYTGLRARGVGTVAARGKGSPSGFVTTRRAASERAAAIAAMLLTGR